MNTLGQRILFLRKKLNRTQKQLADATGLQRGNLSHYEKDKIKPAAEAIIALARYFKVSTDWLLTGKERLTNAYLYVNLDEKERLEVEQYIEYIVWKREHAPETLSLIAEETETFEREE